jgi:RNA polymerase sigma factor (sigma-70 family)
MSVLKIMKSKNKHIEEVISNCQNGDKRSYQVLYEYVYTNLCSVIPLYIGSKGDKDWVFNLAMLKVFQNIHSYKLGTNFLGWARTIIVRATIDHIRSKNTAKVIMSPVDEVDQSFLSSHLDNALDNIETDYILNMINELSESERLVFNLYEIEGYKHNEISKITSINENTSKWLLAKAKQNLRSMVELFNTKQHGK